MNKTEACKILEIAEGSTKEEANNSFRKLSRKYHPDLHRSKSEEEQKEMDVKFKEINEANQVMQSDEPDQNQFGDNQELQDILRNFDFGMNFGGQQVFFHQTQRHTQNITITFAEAVMGCTKQINIKARNACSNCMGRKIKDNKACSTCKGLGTVDGDTVGITINLPPGLHTNQTLNVDGYNNIRVIVTPEENMVLDGTDIISTMDLTLLEALKGTNKKVKTIKGEMTLKVRSGIKNLDRISAKNLGVAGYGSHIFVININYPAEEIQQKIIELLEKETNGI